MKVLMEVLMRVPVKVLMGKIINIHGELSIVMLDYGSRRVFYMSTFNGLALMERSVSKM